MDGHARFDTLQVALTESSSITRTVVADNNGKFYYSTGSTGGGGGGGTGTVTSVSVVTANGLAGSVANPTTTPSITLSTTVTGILKGNGTAISAATPGTDYITSTAGTASWSQNSVTSSFVTASNVYGPYGSNSVISASYTATSSFATSASYAANGGVTQLLAGTNITLSPTNGLGQVTINSTGGGSGSNYNTATGSYGSFYDTTTQTATTINTPYSMSFNTTDISNGVAISGSGNTKIKFTNPGVYDLQFSAQLARAVGSGTENVLIWIRKNGSNIANSNTDVTFAGGTNVRQVAAWNWFLNVAASDYYEIMWSSTSTNIILQSDATTTPAVPSVIATVTRIDTFLSNTGSFSGSFTGNLIGTSSYANYASQSLSASYALTASYVPNAAIGSGSINYVPKWTTTSVLGNSLIYDNGTNVGINTTSPSFKLDIDGSFRSRGFWTDDSAVSYWGNGPITSSYGILTYDTGYAAVYATSGNNLRLGANGNISHLFISTSGNVGIGTTSPSRPLHLVGASALFQNAGSFELDLLNSTSGNYLRATAGATDSNIGTIQNIPFSFIMNSSRVGQFTSTNGNLILQNGGTFSDTGERLKVSGSVSITGNTLISAGNLSIFTTNTPRRINLQVANGSKAAAIGIEAGGTMHSVIGADTSGNDFLQIASRAGISFYSNSTIGDIVTDPTNERMRISTAGLVGIGTTSPARLLHIKAGAGAVGAIRVDSDNGNVANILEVPTNGDWSFSTNSQEVMRLSNANGGRVGIGTSSPSSTLTVSGSISGSGAVYFKGLTTTNQSNVVTIDTTTGQLYYTASSAFGGGSSLTGGSTNYIARWASSTTLTTGSIFDDGTNVGIGTITPAEVLTVNGNLFLTGSSNSVWLGNNADYGNRLRLVTNGTNALIDYSSSLIFRSGNTSNRVTFDTNGNVGIGTTSPAAKLHVDDGTGAALFVGLASNIYYRAYEHIWQGINGTTERMRIDPNGNVGIGTTSPGATLDISSSLTIARIRGGGATNQGAAFYVAKSDGNTLTAFGDSSAIIGGTPNLSSMIWTGTSIPLAFYLNGSERMRITSAGNVGIGTTSPSTLFYVNGYTPSNWITTFNNTGSSGHQMYFGYNDGSTTRYGLFIAGGPGSGAGNFDLAVDSKFYVTSGGNVGIGTTGPASKLEVYSASGINYIYTTNGTADTFNGLMVRYNNTNYMGAIGNPSSGEFRIGGFNVSGYYTTIYSNNSETVRVTAGNVGIGTTSPVVKLDVNGSINLPSGYNLTWGGAYGANIPTIVGVSGASGYVAIYPGGSSSAEKVRVTNGGNVGIGTTAPSYSLQVHSDSDDLYIAAVGSAPSLNLFDTAFGPTIAGTIGLATGPNNFIQNSVPGDLCIATRGSTNAAAYIMFGSGSTMTAYISGSGDMYIAGTLTQGSTRNIKENIIPISNALSTVVQIQGVTYNKKDGSAINEPGFIAEDMYSILPSLVSLDRAGDPQGIKYTNLTAYLVEAIKELKAEIELLKNK